MQSLSFQATIPSGQSFNCDYIAFQSHFPTSTDQLWTNCRATDAEDPTPGGSSAKRDNNMTLQHNFGQINGGVTPYQLLLQYPDGSGYFIIVVHEWEASEFPNGNSYIGSPNFTVG